MDAQSSTPATPRPELPPAEASGALRHLTVALLREYRAHRLEAGEEARIQEHLAVCDECRDLAVDVSAFFDAEEPGEKPVRVDKGAAWGRLEASLAREGWFAERRKAGGPKRSPLLRAAAVAALVVAGLGQLVAGFGRPATILVAAGAFKGAEDDVVTVELPARLKLTPAAVVETPEFRADLLDSSGSRIRSFGGLRADGDGKLPLRLLRWQLDPGRYRLEVRAVPPRPDSAFDEFEFEVGGR